MKWGFVLILLFSCQPNAEGIDTKTLSVFSDFNYVGSGQAKWEHDGSLDRVYVALHGESEQQKPSKLVKGIQYVFHYKDSTPNNEEMGLRILPERLKKMGYKILEAPNQHKMLYTYVGGPYFYIKFSDGDHEAIIFNQRDSNIEDQERIVEDYVLVILR